MYKIGIGQNWRTSFHLTRHKSQHLVLFVKGRPESGGPAILLQKKQNHWQDFFNLGHLHNVSFNFFNSFWPTVRIQYDPISHYSPHLNFSFFAVVINSVLRSSQLENVTKNNKMPNVECKSKVVFSSASIQNWKFQIEDQNRRDVRLLWGTIAGKKMIYQAYMFL